ncbi:MAG: YdcF family protein [Deltaproteobacteria bacterium]|nr:YdcF family protein [Deltaproteobacteria bacterium]
MEQIYDVLKSFVDPVFIIFFVLLVSCLIGLATGKKKGGPLLMVFALILLYGFSIETVSHYLSYRLEKDYIRHDPAEEKTPLDVIVVLGGGTYDIRALKKTFPGESTTVRLIHGVQMYREHGAKYLVCSGKGEGGASVAALMAGMAETFGVPGERIRIEAKSRNTYEHAVEFNKMFTNKDIKIGLVTSAFHMKRSETEFRKYFKKVVPLPSGYLYASPAGTPAVRYIPQSQWLLNNTLIFREYAGRLWYKIKDV